MSKSDAAWLSIRMGGVIACFAALWHACAAGYFVYVMASPQLDSGHGYFFEREAAIIHSVITAGYSLLAMYLLRRGSAIHCLLVRQ